MNLLIRVVLACSKSMSIKFFALGTVCQAVRQIRGNLLAFALDLGRAFLVLGCWAPSLVLLELGFLWTDNKHTTQAFCRTCHITALQGLGPHGCCGDLIRLIQGVFFLKIDLGAGWCRCRRRLWPQRLPSGSSAAGSSSAGSSATGSSSAGSSAAGSSTSSSMPPHRRSLCPIPGEWRTNRVDDEVVSALQQVCDGHAITNVINGDFNKFVAGFLV